MKDLMWSIRVDHMKPESGEGSWGIRTNHGKVVANQKTSSHPACVRIKRMNRDKGVKQPYFPSDY